MDLFKAAERLMAMDDAAWARHANPASGLSRIASSIPIFFALYSVHWIGAWALIPIIATLVWIFINPRLWPAPKHVTSWVGEAVLGERAFINRKRVPVPTHHTRMAHITTIAAIAFFAIAAYGFVTGQFWTAFAGWFAAVLAKCWFLDRMVWLWRDVKDDHEVYQAWSKADWTASFDPPIDDNAP